MTIGLSDWISCTASGSVAEREPYQIELIADTTLASRLPKLLAFCTMCPRPRPRSFQMFRCCPLHFSLTDSLYLRAVQFCAWLYCMVRLLGDANFLSCSQLTAISCGPEDGKESFHGVGIRLR